MKVSYEWTLARNIRIVRSYRSGTLRTMYWHRGVAICLGPTGGGAVIMQILSRLKMGSPALWPAPISGPRAMGRFPLAPSHNGLRLRWLLPGERTPPPIISSTIYITLPRLRASTSICGYPRGNRRFFWGGMRFPLT